MMIYKRLFPVIWCVVLLTCITGAAQAQKVIKHPISNEEWSRDYQPFRIVGNLYYVGTYDLAAYLITTSQGHILINTGLDDSEALIRAHVDKLGFKFKDIKILLTTHAHFDHVGAMAAIKKQTGATMMIHEKDAAVLADGGDSDYILGGKGSTFVPLKADRLLHDRDTIKLGEMRLVVRHHPGHTPGASSFLFDVKDGKRIYKVLIANMPSILDETDLAGMPRYPDVGKDYAYTLIAMKQLTFDLWLSSHASQFELHKKHKPGDAYNPNVFNDRAGYDASLDEWEQVYSKRSGSK
jgi:metallo-beta-lactamase class B